MALKKRDIPTPPKATGKAATSARSKSARSARTASTSAPAPAAPKAAAVSTKNFIVEEWSSKGRGKKIIIYAESGMGKTTLASLAPTPAFIGLDDGGVVLQHPITGENLRYVPGIESFSDVRAALQAPAYANYETIVVDTVTLLEEWCVAHMLATVPNEKGAMMNNIVQYGYMKGYRHLYDIMKLILPDCDALVRAGKNVILIAQAANHAVANPGGEDFLRSGPRLYPGTASGGTPSVEALYCEWADHIFRIGYQYLAVDGKKVTGGENKRAIFVHPEPHFRAKSRTLGPDKAVVEFADPTDDSIWVFLFGGTE